MENETMTFLEWIEYLKFEKIKAELKEQKRIMTPNVVYMLTIGEDGNVYYEPR